MPPRFMLFGLLFFLTGASAVLAQQDCNAVRSERGEAAYQQCQLNERENRAKDIIQRYWEELQIQKERMEQHTALQRRSAEEAWELADFALERHIRVFEDRLLVLKREESAKEEREQLKIILGELDLRRRLLKKHYQAVVNLLTQRAELGVAQMDLQRAAYELRVRGWPGIPFAP